MTDETMLTVKQVAQALQANPETVRVWLRAGIIKGIKLGKIWRIPAGELDRIRTATK
ncbi:MAG: helix-turn-helix domain-containing protein [Sphaerochaeta sp.]|jgi:acetyl-CoA synthetase|nr:helix-turn-helix domain-containing protein [Sphaerochaeta sp.]